MADFVNVKGLEELQKFLDQVAPNVEANIMRGALRAGMSVVKPVAQNNVHSVSGELAKGLRIGTRNRGGVVTSNLRATGPHGPVAHLVEFGTRPHNISAKVKGGWLSFMNIFRKIVAHPGTKPKPFMRPALDSMATEAVIASAEYVKKRLATKQGFETSHIMIEGDR